MMIRKLIAAVGMAAAVTWALVGMALADDGPHKGDTGYGRTPDYCASCHRAHTGLAAKLMATYTSQYNLCMSCHGTAATGANTNVYDGVYDATSAGLRGGGFVNVTMDTNVDGTPVAAATVSSKHNAGSSSLGVWGYGAAGTPAAGNITITLECGSCHNPHGNGYYRVLRPQPKAVNASGTPVTFGVATVAVSTPSGEATPTYAISYTSGTVASGAYYARVTTYVPSEISSWCSQCHTRYLTSGTGSGSTNQLGGSESIFKYRHYTDGLTGRCLACHVAHGTSAAMGTASDAVAWPDAATPVSGANSRLLWADNRGTCRQPDCHSSAIP